MSKRLLNKNVEVTWVDAITYLQEHTDIVLRKNLCIKRTVGTLIYKDKDCIVIRHESCGEDNVIDATVIPYTWQTKIKKL